MKPVESPSADIYVAPRDFSASQMHYAIVQVSKRKYMIVEYAGAIGLGFVTGERDQLPSPSFVTVSKPLDYEDACYLANKLTRERTNKS